jgi:hypothetical protein
MSANIETQVPARLTRDHILSLLDDLPPESLAVVEQFVRFLREQTRQGQPVVSVSEEKDRPSYHYPTIPLPVSVLDGLIGIMPPVGGDALADTEALYDEV